MDGSSDALASVPRPVLIGAGAVVVLGLIFAARSGGSSGTQLQVIQPTTDTSGDARAAADMAARTSAFSQVVGLFNTAVGSDTAGTLARVQGDVSNKQTAAALDAARTQAWAGLQGQAIAAGASTQQAQIAADTAYSIASNATAAGVQIAGISDSGNTARARIADAGSTSRTQIAAWSAEAINKTTQGATTTRSIIGGIGDVIKGVISSPFSFFGL